jgi:hypothetical protein
MPMSGATTSTAVGRHSLPIKTQHANNATIEVISYLGGRLPRRGACPAPGHSFLGLVLTGWKLQMPAQVIYPATILPTGSRTVSALATALLSSSHPISFRPNKIYVKQTSLTLHLTRHHVHFIPVSSCEHRIALHGDVVSGIKCA